MSNELPVLKPAPQAGDTAASEPSTENVVQFPHVDDERNHRIMAEAMRLASLAPGEWKLWCPGKAKEFGIEPNTLAELVQAQIKDREQKAAEKLKLDKLQEARAKEKRLIERDRQREQQRIEDAAKVKAKEKANAFRDIIKLSADQNESKLNELATRLKEDPAALKVEFAEYCTAEVSSSSATSMSEWDSLEPWPEPVTTAELVEDIIARFNSHVRIRTHDGVLIAALWDLMTWVHEEVAHHSPYLGAISPKDDCGKTTWLIEVLGRLAWKPWLSGSTPTLSTIFRIADREKPTQFFDNVDKLFESDHEVADLFLNGSTRGIKYIRNERIGGEWVQIAYDPFTPKSFTLIGTAMPRPLLGRSLLIESWPLKLGDQVVEVDPFNEELMEAFKTLRRKTKRWKQDNAALKNAQPLFPAGFSTRPRANAKLLLAIAELAGDSYAERARTALDKLLREKEPSWLELLLQELWNVFVTERRKDISSEQLVTRLNRDPTSVWREYTGARGNRMGHKVTQREVAALLKMLVRPVLVDKARKGGYRAKDFFEKEIFQHFLHRDPLILSPDTETKKKTKRSHRKKKSIRSRRKARG
jgi:hypothetical protein